MKTLFFNNRLASGQLRLGYRAGVLGLGERCRCCLPQAVLLLVAVVFASGNQSVGYGQQQETAESSGPIVEDEDPQVRIGDLVQEGESADLELAPPLVPRPDFEPLEIRQALVPTQQSSGSRTMGREVAPGRAPSGSGSEFNRRIGRDVTSLLSETLDGEESDTVSESAEQMGGGKLKPSVVISVELQADVAFFTQDDNNRATVGEIPDGAGFRRSRLGIFGELYDTIEYRLEWDFASNERPRFLDNWVALTDLPLVGNVIAGHFFEPFSLERYSPNRFITFNERALTDTFAPARNMGAMVYGSQENLLTYAGGVFRSNSDGYGDDVSLDDGYAFTVHGTFLPWFEQLNDYQQSLLHLGASASYRLPGDDPVRYATLPSARMRQQGVGRIPVFVDTGNIDDARHTFLLGLESAFVYGPWSVQAEWIMSEVNRRENANPLFHAAYVYGSVFLTGEGRSYSPTSILGRFREGIFQRITPRRNVFDRSVSSGWTGIGAWEAGVRWSYIDLNDAGIRGGEMQEMTYGLTWYLNPYTKGMFNYVRPILNDPIQGRSVANMFTTRIQFEY